MRKHYVSKSAIFLAMLVATGSAQFVKAETPTTTTSPATSLTDASASTTPTTNTTSTVTPALDPNTNFTVDSSATTSTTTPSPVEAAAISPVIATAQPTTNVTSASLAPAANTMATTPVEGQTVDVRIISTTDLHSNLVNYDYYQDKASQTIGLAKAAVLIDQAKAENPNAVLVDNGDILQGTPLGTYEALIDPLQPGEVHPMYAALDKLGFDASTLGNHEFNYGLTFIENAIASAGLPILNANVFDAATGEYLFQPYAIVTKSFTDANGQAVDLKIGITGIVPPQIMLWDKANLGTIDYVRQTVGETTAPINSYFALVKDDPSVQIVNNAQLWYAKQQLAGTPEADLPLLSAAAPFKAGTRNDPTAYTDIPAGPIAIKNVADLYLYDNVTAILKLTGADIKEWLEMSAGQFNTIDPNVAGPQNLVNTDYRTYNFDVIDGVTYEFDVTQPNKYDAKGNLLNPNASRVRNLKFQGKEIDPNQEFMVVTNNYRASGSFPGVKNATINRLLNLENRQAIINYIVSEKTINPSADNNWYFADTIQGLDLHFLSADTSKNLIGDKADISYTGPSTIEGFGDFVFTYVKPELPVATPETPQETGSQLTENRRQEIHQLATRVYNQTKATSSSTTKAELPKAGSQESKGLFFMGLSLLGLAGLITKKEERQ